MSLNKKTLEDGIKNLPNSFDNLAAARNLSKVFVDYYSDAQAGAGTPSLLQQSLETTLLAGMESKNLLQLLGTHLQTWFLTASWSGTGVVALPGTTIASGPVLDSQMSIFISKTLADKSNPSKNNLSEMANIIHSWSTRGNIVVTLTNVNTGATFSIPAV